MNTKQIMAVGLFICGGLFLLASLNKHDEIYAPLLATAGFIASWVSGLAYAVAFKSTS
jgi:hypothetical protein